MNGYVLITFINLLLLLQIITGKMP